LKEKLIESIESFIAEKITFAQDILIKNGLAILSDKKEEVILVYGNQETQTIEDILISAHHTGTKNFRVIIVDSAPDYLGRSLVKRLAAKGIKCQYTLINMVNFLIKTVTKVLMATTYVLCNGAVVAPIGSS
jgi:translation initiation factor 2B subunit (eIF-2B alpha/beta/delta family)